MSAPIVSVYKKWNLPFRRLISRRGLWVLLSYILLNVILLIPFYIFNRSDSRFFPIPGIDLILSGENINLLKVNLEVTVALAFWANCAVLWNTTGKVWFWRIFTVFYSLALSYKVYAGVMVGIYKMQPNFSSDSSFIANGLPFMVSALSLPWWFFLFFVVVLVIVFIILVRWTRWILVSLSENKLEVVARGFLTGVALLALIYGWTGPSRLSDPGSLVNSLVVEVLENIQSSLASKRAVADFDITSPFRTYGYAQYDLVEKPDIYLIFLESYGSVLLTKDHFREPYLAFMDDFGEQIESAGWSAVSVFSKAPTWGGGTWISYTNVLFGLLLEEQSQYAAVHAAYQRIPYPNMGRYLLTQGYDYVWVAPIQRRISPEREAADRNFFGYSRWITLEGMGYNGPLYGWGPSPPDQYTLGYVGNTLQSQHQPTFLVYLTQNAHYPWIPLPPTLADWRSFAETKSNVDFLQEEGEGHRVFRQSRQNYLNAMAYTMKTLGEFISNLENPEAVLLLIGDHQPPAVSYKGDGFGTMIHIISQDDMFLESFHAYGFKEGLLVDGEIDQGITHAGFYSLFVRNLVARYGTDPHRLPPYLPDGLTFIQP